MKTIAPASKIDHCSCCGRPLDPEKIVWLEQSFVTSRWYAGGQCPPEESQGGFPFGAACARKIMRKPS